MLLHTVRWIWKIHWDKVMLVGVLYTIVATIAHQLEAFIMIKYYMMPEYFGLWSRLMMPSAGPPPTSFFITSTIVTLVSGVSLALVYYYIREMLPKNSRERIFLYADLIIGLQFIFFTLPSYLLFNIPIQLLVSWFISSFVLLLTASYVCVKVIK